MSEKWGESFLKSGLPLEHLTILSFTSIGWECSPRWEYRRVNRSGTQTFFELDMIAWSPHDHRGDLRLLVECKYHDRQRFWLFLPCTTENHLAQHDALSAGEELEKDSYVVHYAPYDPLMKATSEELLNLAPTGLWGVTLSGSGQRVDNSVHNALEQLAYGFVPFCLDRLYSFTSCMPAAALPCVVTNTELYLLKPDVTDFEQVRKASKPADIADPVPWLWCYYAPSRDLLNHNMGEIDEWRRQYPEFEFEPLESNLGRLWSSPHWVLVCSIDGLPAAIRKVYSVFLALDKDCEPDEKLREAVERAAAARRKRLANEDT